MINVVFRDHVELWNIVGLGVQNEMHVLYIHLADALKKELIWMVKILLM